MIEVYQCCDCDNFTTNRSTIYICACGKSFCFECLKVDFSNENEDYGLCQYCTGDEATDKQLLEYALDRLNINKESLFKDYKFDFIMKRK